MYLSINPAKDSFYLLRYFNFTVVLYRTNIGTIDENFCVLDEKYLIKWFSILHMIKNVVISSRKQKIAENVVIVYFFANVVFLSMIYTLALLLTSSAVMH